MADRDNGCGPAERHDARAVSAAAQLTSALEIRIAAETGRCGAQLQLARRAARGTHMLRDGGPGKGRTSRRLLLAPLNVAPTTCYSGTVIIFYFFIES